MRRHVTLFTVAVLLAGLLAPVVHAKSAAELLREGLYAEEVEGNLDAAIGIYQQIILDSSAPRNLVAQALYRQGSCYLKKRQEPDARAAFQKLVTEYSDQTELVEKVKPMMEELGNADPASLMPPEVIAYVEIGTPGRQVETILNMLKGTPLENPLNAINMAKDPGQTGEHNGQAPASGGGPADVIGKVLNPAMMAELKKIRGLGIGLTDVTQGNPPAIFVLFPGQSDALRGLLQMGISMLGQASESIEGMTTLKFADGGGAAFDNTVFIVVTPSPRAAEILAWSIKQYKGTARQPSLASANASFARVSKQARQQNALTLWVNVGETYQRLLKILPADQVPQQLRMADGLINIKNVDDLIAAFSLRETGVAVEANVNFKDGSQSMAYNLIRTPNLNKAALKAVPADAIALLSLTLGGADTPQAQAAGAQIQSATGLDIGPQIFGNVEQVSLFILPGKAAAAAAPQEWGGIPPVVQSIGLAVTSREPQKTQQLLMTLLKTANLVSADAQEIPASGQYEVALANQMKLIGYTDDASKTMVLSLSPQVVGSSVTALKEDGSVVTGGKLQEAISTLSPKASKLVVVNVAGALGLAAQNMHLPSEDATAKAEQSIRELAKATEKTTLRLMTSEEPNSFGIRLSVSDLPPMNQIVGTVTQLAKMISDAKQSMAGGAKDQVPLSVPEATRPITVKDEKELATLPAQAIEHVAYNAPASPEDLSASFRTTWDKQALYLLVDVTDDKSTDDSVEFWLDDSVEVFIDADNSKSNTYEDNDYQYYFTWEGSRFTAAGNQGESRHNKMEGIESSAGPTDKGYRLVIKVPWSTLGVTPRAGVKIGIDVHVNDDDDGGDRDTKLMWHTENDIAWQHPSALGTIALGGLVGWWKLDETGGDKAADSSGNGHDATLHGDRKWQPSGGKVGGALQLDGAGDYADTGYNDNLGTWTVAAWVKSPAAPADDNGSSGPVHRENNFQINWNHTLDEFRGAAGVSIGGTWYAASFGELQPDTWYHLAATLDGKSLKAYKNGVLITTNSEASGASDPEPQTLKFGKHARENSFFAGVIDDVRVYNVALPEAQIQQIYEGK